LARFDTARNKFGDESSNAIRLNSLRRT